MTSRDPKPEGSHEALADPLARLLDEHRLQLDLCDLLEHIADSLPDNASPQLAQVAAIAVETGWPRHIEFEEKALFPTLRRIARNETGLEEALAQLSGEHAHDLDADDELLVALADLARGGTPSNPDMIGYLLRSYFVTLRRHVQWENAYLIPLARRVLTAEAMAELAAWLDDDGSC